MLYSFISNAFFERRKWGLNDMRFIYPAVVSRNPDGTYHAEFPDLEQCEADGDSVDDVLRNANLAAHSWIELEMMEDDPMLPPASDADTIPLKDGEFVRSILVIYKVLDGWEE